jgi:malonate transporter
VPLMNIGAVWPMARHGQGGFLKELTRNPLIIATAGGLLANVLGLSIPAFVEPTLSRIGSSAVSLGLLAAGAGLQFGALQQSRALSVSLLGIRHLLLPTWALAVAYVYGLPPQQATILLAYASVPTASSCYVLAVRMGYDGPYVAGLVTLSTLLGMVSLPFALGLLRPLIL